VSAVAWTMLTAVAVLLSVVAHEMMHAVAVHRLAVDTPRAGLGFFWPRWRVGTLRWWGQRTEVFVSPWLLGAWVSSDSSPEARAKLDAARWRDFAWFCGAGVWINTVLGFVFLGLAAGMVGHPLLFVAFACTAVVVAALGDRFTAYVAPLLWPAAVASLVWGMVATLGDVAAGNGQPLGLVGIARLLVAHDLHDLVALVGVINVGLAVSNMLPFMPLDGGQMFTRLLRVWRVPRQVVTFVEVVGLALVLLLFVVSEVTDVVFW
jgi:Zn-dependent protease